MSSIDDECSTIGIDGDLVVCVRDLHTGFGDQIVHDHLDLDVRRGEILGVIGGTGAGKSVLMRTILGLNHPQAGSIQLLGFDALSGDETVRQQLDHVIGVLFQNGALFSSLTVAENIAVPLKEHYSDLSEELRAQLVRLKIRLAGLPEDAAGKLPSQLSPGMRKRAALARALSSDPILLLLDEPTTGLDPIRAAGFDQLILTLQRALGFTVFLISHDLDTIYAICDRVAVIADKRVIVNAPIEEVERFDHPWIREYFHGPRGCAARRSFQNNQLFNGSR